MIDSPCKQLCSLDPESRQCVGCGRAASEISGWLHMTDDEQRAVVAALPGRLDVMREARIARNAVRRGRSARRGRRPDEPTPVDGASSC